MCNLHLYKHKNNSFKIKQEILERKVLLNAITAFKSNNVNYLLQQVFVDLIFTSKF